MQFHPPQPIPVDVAAFVAYNEDAVIPEKQTVVLASATVDVIESATPQRQGTFRVNVWGQAPYDQTRTYEISAKNETSAAQQGIDRFAREMEALPTGN